MENNYMKSVIVAGLVIMSGFALSSHAQVSSVLGDHYREFTAKIALTSGSLKKISLQVNREVLVSSFGDADIPDHGFYNYNVTGSVIENGKTCSFEVLLTQGNGVIRDSDMIVKSGADREDSFKLCSGGTLTVKSVRALLIGGSTLAELHAGGVSKDEGQGVINFERMHEVTPPADEPDDVY